MNMTTAELEAFRPLAQSLLLYILSCCVVHGICYYMLFRKAGQKGGTALIPFYSIYQRFRMGWSTNWLWALCFFIGLSCLGFFLDSAFVSIFSLLSLLACLGIEMVLQYHMGRAFGWGVFPSILLCLLNPIVLPVLAFFGKTYKGPDCGKTAAPRRKK